MLRHADSFGWYTGAQALRYYQSGADTYATGAFGPGGGPGIRFTGSASAQLTRSHTAAQPFAPSGAVFIAHFDLYLTAAPASQNTLVECLLGASSQGKLEVNTSRQFQARRGSTDLGSPSSYVIPLLKPVVVEVKITIDNSSGSVVVSVTEDGTTTTVLNVTGVDTQEGASATWDAFSFGGVSATGATQFASLIVMDGSGSAPFNDFLGPDVEVSTRFPNGAGFHQEWSRVGHVNRWLNVDEVTANDDQDYNYATVSGEMDTHAMQDVTNPALVVYGAAAIAVARTTAGGMSLSPVLRISGIDFIGAPVAGGVGTSWLAYAQLYETLPAGDPWDVDLWNAVELGYERV